METRDAWKSYDENALAECERIAREYIEFISQNKIEREFAAAAIEQAKAAGYVDLDEAFDEDEVK